MVSGLGYLFVNQDGAEDGKSVGAHLPNQEFNRLARLHRPGPVLSRHMLADQSLSESTFLSRTHLMLLTPEKVAYKDKQAVLELLHYHIHCAVEKNSIAAC